jgi:hypothetical protein
MIILIAAHGAVSIGRAVRRTRRAAPTGGAQEAPEALL